MRQQPGFTLIEIMIALVIFAILGVLAAMSLHQTIQNDQALNVRDKRLTQLQLAITLIRRDVLQAIDRPIINAHNEKSAAMVGGGASLELTRTGLFNPLSVSERTDMQRIGYRLSQGILERLTWTALDQPPKATPEAMSLIDNVESLTWSFVDANNKTVDHWPSGKQNAPSLPKAVLLKIQVRGEGEIDGVFQVTAVGVIRDTSTTP